jgi:S1-C subfamily serine protease/Tfp pilus assembly protein PilF
MLIGAKPTLMVALATLIGSVVAARAETSSGSGVVIGSKGEILTNAHVVQECRTITVKLASGKSEPAELVARDERNDLAVIHLTGANNPPTSIAVFREGLPVRAGDAVVALGYPLSGVLAAEANVSVGNISALSGIADDSRYLQISAPVQPGNSGGPLLDGSGHLVGIVTAKLDAVRIARFTGDIPQNVNFALKVDVARTFLDSKGIAYQTARSEKQLSPADIGETARPYTVRIECQQTSSEVATAPPIPRQALPKGIEVTRQQIDWCALSNKPSPDLIINGCTAIIQFGRASASIPGWVFGNRGIAYIHNDNYPSAIADLTEAIQRDPKGAKNFTFRGMAYYKMRDYDRAISDYTDAVRLDPKDASPFFLRGEAYYQKNNYNNAIADYTDAIRLNPKDDLAFFDRGMAYEHAQDHQRAISDFIKVAQSTHAPRDMVMHAATQIGFMYWENRKGVAQDYTQAMHWFRIAADMGEATAMTQVGLLWALAGDCSSARQWFEKAIAAGDEETKEVFQRAKFGPCRW